MVRRRIRRDLELAHKLVKREPHAISSEIPAKDKDYEKPNGMALRPHNGPMPSEHQCLRRHYSSGHPDGQRSKRADMRFRANVAGLSPANIRRTAIAAHPRFSI